MKKKVTKRKNYVRRKKGGIKALLLCVLILAALVFCIAMFFRVTEITVSGESRYSSEEIIAAGGIKTGDNIFLIGKDEAEKSITDAMPYLAAAEIKRVFPDKIVIEVSPAEEAVTAVVGNGYAILSAEGKVLGIASEKPNLPELIGSGIASAEPGSVPDFRDETTLRIFRTVWSELKDAGLDTKISELDISKRYNITFDYLARVMVNLGNTEKLKTKIAAATICIEDNVANGGKAEIKFQDDTAKTAIYHPLTDEEWIDLKLGS